MIKGFTLTCFPADPSGRQEKVLSCAVFPSSRGGHHTLAVLGWHGLCRAISALATAQPDTMIRVGWEPWPLWPFQTLGALEFGYIELPDLVGMQLT